MFCDNDLCSTVARCIVDIYDRGGGSYISIIHCVTVIHNYGIIILLCEGVQRRTGEYKLS